MRVLTYEKKEQTGWLNSAPLFPVSGPAERIFKLGEGGGGPNANALAWANKGGPGACSPWKIWNWSLLKWLEMGLKLPKVKLIFISYKKTSDKVAFKFDQI